MIKFEKVSFEQFLKDSKNINFSDDRKRLEYDNLQLPVRATNNSAGYDIFTPYGITLKPNETIEIPLGIRCKMDSDKFLAIVPRSGLGFKYGIRLENTIGIIDSDYYYSDNEGHIMLKLRNSGDKDFSISYQNRICQGIFLPYFITDDDKPLKNKRNGGFGSTGK